MAKRKIYTFIDLFAGLGGIRIGLEQAAKDKKCNVKCVLTSEIKKSAIKAYQHHFPGERANIDVRKVKPQEILYGIDIILAGFPCQPFSAAGSQKGFQDTRGTMFFEIERIIEEATKNGHKPKGFILENVEGLVTHGGKVEGKPYGKTLQTILAKLDIAGYNVNWKLIDASEHGLPQARKRVYIVGVSKEYGEVDLENLPKSKSVFGDIMEHGLPTEKSKFSKLLLKKYRLEDLEGMRIKDKRGGARNIHSWDFEIKGKVSCEQKKFLNQLFKERRKKKWASIIGIEWMDGMPLTIEQIRTFYDSPKLQQMLDDLVEKGYLVFEHPKQKLYKREGELQHSYRVYDTSKPKGYNIVTGKLSFPYSGFLDPKEPTPTMVASDMEKFGVVDGDGFRHLSVTEGLRLFGYDNYNLSCLYENTNRDGDRVAFDLLGNSVCVPVIRLIACRLLDTLNKEVQ